MQATYVHHPGRQIGTVLATSEGTSASTGTWNYYFQDGIGSTRGVWDDAGDRLGKYEYTPFGGKYADHGADITRKFTGHDWDQDARLYYTAYRYYSPDANRWLTRDPLGMAAGPNVYAYVVNNPVTMWDSLGQCPQDFLSDFDWLNGLSGPEGREALALLLWENSLSFLSLVASVLPELALAFTCLTSLGVEVMNMAAALGGQTNSVGATAFAAGMTILSAVLFGYFLYISQSQLSDGQQQALGFLAGGAQGGAVGMMLAVNMSQMIAGVLGFGLGAGCAMSSVIVLQKYGLI